MNFTWIGQAGLLIKKENVKIMVDPYLSNSVVKVNPNNYRRVPINEELFDIQPNIMILTHNHLDHYDPETFERFVNQSTPMTVLCPKSVFEQIKEYKGIHNYVSFNRYSVWTEYGITFTSVKAEHSDPDAIGIIINDENKIYYITGDTLYNKDIFSDLPDKIDTVFLPINGLGNNMNMTDAGKFADKTSANKVVPMHWGMFDNINPMEFKCNKKIVFPELYKQINI